MNEVSIIINGVRYDAVECKVGDECVTCELYHLCKEHSFPFGRLCNIIPQKEGNTIFKKSTKSFEKKHITIETKYNIGDEVWVKPTNYIEKGIIHGIDISAHMEYGIITRKSVSYDVRIDNCLFTFYEQGIFPTKEEILKSL